MGYLEQLLEMGFGENQSLVINYLYFYYNNYNNYYYNNIIIILSKIYQKFISFYYLIIYNKP